MVALTAATVATKLPAVVIVIVNNQLPQRVFFGCTTSKRGGCESLFQLYMYYNNVVCTIQMYEDKYIYMCMCV